MKNHIVAIDHGNKLIKTGYHFQYAAGYIVSDNQPINKQNLLEYQGKYYSLSPERFPISDKKFEDERCFVLTLPAIADAIAGYAGTNESIDVVLGVGLDISNYGRDKDAFRKYFIRDNVEFAFNGSSFKVNVKDAVVFPQGYAGYLSKFNDYKALQICNVIDIGSHTIDLITIENGILNIKSCICLKDGIIKLFNTITQETQKIDFKMTDVQIESIIMEKKSQYIDRDIINLVNTKTQEYTKDLISKISEFGFELKNPTIFHGGGAILLRKYIENTGCVKYPEFMDEYANANGYLILTQQYLTKR